ncbi:MAG TPA: hypothetical protein VIK92_04485 [Thermaerobacter sp.]
MHVWMFDPENTSWHYGYVPSSASAPVQGTLRQVSPALWFGIVLSVLRGAGYGLPTLPEGSAASALVTWDREGNASVFPLGKDAADRWTELGHVLHRVAQSLIEDPEAWESAVIEPDHGDGRNS